MPIVYNKKSKTWELKIKEGDHEELKAVMELGKKVIVGELSHDFTKEVYRSWLDIKKNQMFSA